VTVAIHPGTTFGGYRVESVVGRGGMGVVYRATDLSLHRPVALKLIAPELAEDEHFRARFLVEPRLAASLDHPGVVPIYEAGEREGQLYLAMRWVEGSDLRRILEREGRLPPERAVELLLQVADALDATHRRGLVHRDVKPGNILVDDDGHAYLTDFGITRELGDAQTDGGRLAGTLDYLAPEQVRGDDVDGRADLYALGCVLYECLGGAPPFRRATEAETLWAHLREPPRPLRDDPGVDRVMRKGLAKEPGDRYSSCTELIRSAGGALGLDPSLGGPRISRAALLVVAGALLLAAVAALALARSLGGDDASPRGPSFDVATNSVAAIDANGGRIELAAPLPGRPTDVASWRGTAWVSTVDSTSLTAVNARTRSISRTFPLPGRADAVATGAGAVWVVDGARGAVSKIEPGYDHVRQRIRYRPSAHAVRPRGRLQAPRASLAVSNGAVWLADGARRLLRIDAETGGVRLMPVGRRLDSVAAGEDALWAIGTRSGTVTRFAARGGAVTGRLSLAEPGEGSPLPSAMAVTSEAVWVLNGSNATVTRIDPRTLTVAATIPLAVERAPSDLAASGRTAWVTNGDGTLARIELGSKRASLIRVGESLERVAADGRRVWITTTAFDQKLPGGAG
jgi:DNA-binding beta-propeller fold protein YncE